MALLSELVAACEQQGVDKGPTLSMFARRLREARRVSISGRGRGAAHMTYIDAARFLVACAATDHPEQVADAESVFSNLVYQGEDGIGGVDGLGGDAATLDAFLAKVLMGLGDGSLDAIAASRLAAAHPQVQLPRLPLGAALVVQRGTASAVLKVLGGRYVFRHPSTVALVGAVDRDDRQALKTAEAALERETVRFRTGKNLTAELDERLLRSIATLIASGPAAVAARQGGAHD